MEMYSRLATPKFRRITMRFGSIEIEFRTRARTKSEAPSPEERAYRRARAEEVAARARYNALIRWNLNI